MTDLNQASREQLEQASKRYSLRSKQRESRQENLKPGGDWRKVEDPDRVASRLNSLSLEEIQYEMMAQELATEGIRSSENPNQRIHLLERILQENDLLATRFLHRGSKIARVVGRVLIRENSQTIGYGTGFLVSPRLLLTNNHVLKSEDLASTSKVEFDYFERSDGSTSPVITCDLDPSLFFITNSRLDFTIVAIAPTTKELEELRDRETIRLVAKSGKALVGEPVNVIQHPGGEPQQIAIKNNTVVDVFDDFIHYQADTQRGSSGAPVLNMQWELAALHHMGVPKRNNDGRILLRNGSIWNGSKASLADIDWIANEGIRVSRIVSYVRERIKDAPKLSALFEEAVAGSTTTHITGGLEGGASLVVNEDHELMGESAVPCRSSEKHSDETRATLFHSSQNVDLIDVETLRIISSEATLEADSA